MELHVERSDLMSAGYSPGFSNVLTRWQVHVARNRWLRQEVAVYDPESLYHQKTLRFRTKLSRHQLATLFEIVEECRFRELGRYYQHETMAVTDCPSYFLAVRFEDCVKTVEAYDLYGLVELEQQPAAIRFLRLWEAITAHSPFEKVPIEQGLPRPWWCFW